MSSTFRRNTQDTTAMDWTVERVNTLKDYWNQGRPAAEIAVLIGGVSRNAVIGKIHRLKLIRAGKRRESSAEPSATPRPAKPPKTGVPYNMRRFQTIEARTDPGFTETVVEQDGAGLSLAELTNSTCRWPIGTPGHEGFSFCGALGADLAASRPYCAKHTATARR